MGGRINVAEASEIMVSGRPPNPVEKASLAWMPRPNSPLEKTPHNAGAVANAPVAALIALLDLSAESRRAAHLDGGHDAPLRRGHGRATLLSIGFAVAAEDIRHLELRAFHRPDAQKCWGVTGAGSTGIG
jgi:hypothetical protein